MLSDTNSDPLVPALEQCAAEPIHIPGGVQPFAMLLAAREDGIVTHCSENTTAYLQRSPDAVLGRRLAELLPHDAARMEGIFTKLKSGTVETLDDVTLPIGTVGAFLHHSRGMRVAELVNERNNPHAGQPLSERSIAAAFESLAGLLTQGIGTEDFSSAVVEQLRELTGYDRVMVYRFDAEWNGEVIAESAAEGVDRYIGHHFPSWDIPSQARELYVRARVRVLADAQAMPVPLAPASAPPLDLSFAVSRAMSPIHREYLENMGVRGTLVASVIREGQLWGMITCHHTRPLLPPRSWQPLIAAFARLIAAQVGMQEGGNRSRGVTSAQNLLGRLPQLLSDYSRLGDGLIDVKTGLMEVLAANGIAVRHRGEWFTRGAVPTHDDLTALMSWLEARGPTTFVTDRLGEAVSRFAHLGSVTPGVLAMHIPNTLDGWIVWFRLEHASTVTWAGDYRKGLSVEGTRVRLSPRKSFKAWVAELRGRSRSWSRAELTIAEDVIRPNLLEVMATAYQQQSQLLRRYQHILFEQVHDAVIVTDLDGVVTFWNDGAQRTLGWQTQEMVGRHIMERVPAEDRPQSLEMLRSVQVGGRFSGRYRDTHKSGRAVWLDMRLCRIRDEAGNPIGIMAAARDVTGEKATEDRLRLKQAIVRHSRDGVLATNAGSHDLTALRVVYVNPSFLAETGYQEAEVLGEPLRRFIGERVEQAALERIGNSLRAWEPCRVETLMARKDATTFWVELDMVPLPDEAGNHSRWIVVHRNISDRKAAEATLRASEELFRSAFEFSGIGMAIVGIDGRFLRVNPAMAEMLGHLPEDFAGNSYGAFIHPEDLSADLELAGEAVAGIRNVYELEQRYRASNGQVVWAILTAALIRDDSGKPIHFIRQVQDVTSRRRAEQRARDAWNVFTRGPAILARWEAAAPYRAVAITDSIRQFGFAPEEFTSGRRNWVETVHPEDRWHYLRSIAEARELGRSSLELRYRIVTPGDEVRWVFDYSIPVFDDVGSPVFADGYLLDVTELRQAEEALRANEARMRAIADNLPDGTIYRYILEPDGTVRFVYIGEGIERLLGVPAADVLKSPEAFASRTLTEDREKVAHATESSLTDLSVFNCEFRVRTISGELRWLHCRAAPLLQPNGAIVWDGVAMDVTFRKEAEARLAEREQFLTALFEGCPIGIEVFAPDGTTLRMNPAMQSLMGFPSPTYGVGIHNILTDPLLRDGPLPDAFRGALRGDVTTLIEYPLDLTSPVNIWATARRIMWLDCSFFAIRNEMGKADRVVMFVIDATPRVTGRAEKEILERATQQSQKLDAIGQLAGGIAHDFNNILTGVRVFADLLLEDMKSGLPGREPAEEIRKAAERGANLTRRLLSFSRKQIVHPTTVDVNALVQDMCEMLRRLLGDDVTLVATLASDSPRVLADKGQMEQILLNLALNARDAMPTGGRLSIRTARVRGSELPHVPRAEPTATEYLQLSVTDTGIGMSEDVKARLFEPFFTTKPVGRGTGLGLATTYGIVRQAGGFITVETRLGSGSSFHVFLPATEAAIPTRDSLDNGNTSLPQAGGCVLVVDDDATVRRVAQLVLERVGYCVATAANADEALALYETWPNRIQLLLTDVVMPGLSGPELAARLCSRYPSMRIGYLSGYTADKVLRHGISDEGISFLQKPFSEDQLLQFVSSCLAPLKSRSG